MRTEGAPAVYNGRGGRRLGFGDETQVSPPGGGGGRDGREYLFARQTQNKLTLNKSPALGEDMFPLRAFWGPWSRDVPCPVGLRLCYGMILYESFYNFFT